MAYVPPLIQETKKMLKIHSFTPHCILYWHILQVISFIFDLYMAYVPPLIQETKKMF
jgi:hypothetical protein